MSSKLPPALASGIDAFWSAAGTTRPPTPQDRDRRRAKSPKSGSQSARGAGSEKAAGYPLSLSAKAPLSARRTDKNSDNLYPEFKHVTVELIGREGFNAIAVNGIWRFWRVKSGRLAFCRDVDLDEEDDDIEEEGCSDDSAIASVDATVNRAGHSRKATPQSVRLYLFYASQVDSWLISDAPDASGSVTADCGPVGSEEDLGNIWRVWDGERWCEDRNIEVEVALGGPGFPNLKGLRLISLPPAVPKQRAASQDPLSSMPRAPSGDKPPDSVSVRPQRKSSRRAGDNPGNPSSR